MSALAAAKAVVCWRLPIVPGRFQPSIVSTSELNCRVRDGKGCTLTVINTNFFFCQTLKEPFKTG